MGVYIKSMNMPKNFFRCPFAVIGKTISRTHCRVDARKPKYCCGVGHPDCPLVEVKAPHGRLGDLDALLRYKGDCYDADGRLLYAVGTGSIMCASTIIEAEGKDDG